MFFSSYVYAPLGVDTPGPPMAKLVVLCIPSPQPDLPHPSQGERTGLVAHPDIAAVAIHALGGRNNTASVMRALASFGTQGPSVSSTCGDFPPRPHSTMGLACERWNLTAAGYWHQSARVFSPRSLYYSNWQVFEEWWVKAHHSFSCGGPAMFPAGFDR